MRPIILALLLSSLTSQTTWSSPTFIRPSDNGSLSTMIRTANVQALLALQSKSSDPLLHLYTNALIDRAELRWNESARAARECYEKAIPNAAAVAMAGACAELTAGTLSIQGRRTERDQFATSARTSLYPLLERQLKLPDVAIRSIEGETGPTDIKGPSLERKPKNVLRWARPGTKSAGGRYVALGADGKFIEALFDTGTQRTILTQADAETLGVTHERSVSITMPSPDGKSINVQGKQGIVSTLNLGDAKVDRAEVFVADVPFSVLGLDLIWQSYAAFRLDDQGLHPYDASVSGCTTGNLTLAGPADGVGVGLVADLAIDGSEEKVFIDTGNSDVLDRHDSVTNEGSIAAQTVQATTLSGHVSETYEWSRAKLDVGSESIHVDQRVVTSPPYLSRFVLGNGFLKNGTIDINLKGHSLCLTGAAS